MGYRKVKENPQLDINAGLQEGYSQARLNLWEEYRGIGLEAHKTTEILLGHIITVVSKLDYVLTVCNLTPQEYKEYLFLKSGLLFSIRDFSEIEIDDDIRKIDVLKLKSAVGQIRSRFNRYYEKAQEFFKENPELQNSIYAEVDSCLYLFNVIESHFNKCRSLRCYFKDSEQSIEYFDKLDGKDRSRRFGSRSMPRAFTKPVTNLIELSLANNNLSTINDQFEKSKAEVVAIRSKTGWFLRGAVQAYYEQVDKLLFNVKISKSDFARYDIMKRDALAAINDSNDQSLEIIINRNQSYSAFFAEALKESDNIFASKIILLAEQITGYIDMIKKVNSLTSELTKVFRCLMAVYEFNNNFPQYINQNTEADYTTSDDDEFATDEDPYDEYELDDWSGYRGYKAPSRRQNYQAPKLKKSESLGNPEKTTLQLELTPDAEHVDITFSGLVFKSGDFRKMLTQSGIAVWDSQIQMICNEIAILMDKIDQILERNEYYNYWARRYHEDKPELAPDHPFKDIENFTELLNDFQGIEFTCQIDGKTCKTPVLSKSKRY